MHAFSVVARFLAPRSDYNMTMGAIDNLRYSLKKGGNHFTALGFHFPHLSHRVPLWAVRKYMPDAGLEPNASGIIPAAANRFAPKGAPGIAQSQEVDGKVFLSLPYGGKLYNYSVPSPVEDTFPEWFWSTIRLGYESAISLTDYHVGLMLDEIDKQGIYNDTIVVLISDHGWSTGCERRDTIRPDATPLPPIRLHASCAALICFIDAM